MNFDHKKLQPCDIEIEDGILLKNGSIKKTFKNFRDAASFLNGNKNLKYLCIGIFPNDYFFLNYLEIILGSTKQSVVETVLRWDRYGLKCKYVKNNQDMRDDIEAGNIVSGENVNSEGSWDLINLPECMNEIRTPFVCDPELKRETVEDFFKTELFFEIGIFANCCVCMEADSFGDLLDEDED